jgi:hypothetical protein
MGITFDRPLVAHPANETNVQANAASTGREQRRMPEERRGGRSGSIARPMVALGVSTPTAPILGYRAARHRIAPTGANEKRDMIYSGGQLRAEIPDVDLGSFTLRRASELGDKPALIDNRESAR